MKIRLKENAVNKNLLIWIGILVVLGLISALITYIRALKMSRAADIAAKGVAAVQRSNLTFFGVFVPVLVGVIGYFVYRGMVTRVPQTVGASFLLLAVGIAVALTIAAAVVFKMRGFVEFTVLHILYVAGLAWLYPLLAAR
jgi:hypothetical protein